MKKASWIFIRGLARHSGHWGPFIPVFKKFFPEDEIELIDIRGNGHWAHSPSLTSISQNVRDLRDRSQTIRAEKKPYLLTISLGSMIGVEWAHRYPEELSGVVTINTSDRSHCYFWERMQPANYLSLISLLPYKKNSPLLEKRIIDLITEDFPGKDEWAESFSKMPQTSRINFVKQVFAASQYNFPDKKPKVDLLMLNSLGDKLVHPVCTERIAESWKLKVHTHPTAGHDIPLQDPTWVSEQILQWRSSIEAYEKAPLAQT